MRSTLKFCSIPTESILWLNDFLGGPVNRHRAVLENLVLAALSERITELSVFQPLNGKKKTSNCSVVPP